MKKLILFIVILIASFNISKAQDNESYLLLEATEINYKIGNTWTGWESLKDPIPASINFNTHQIIIYSEKRQIIDHAQFRHYTSQDYDLYTAPATDSDYLSIVIELYFYKSGVIIFKVEYSDFEYKYKMRITN